MFIFLPRLAVPFFSFFLSFFLTIFIPFLDLCALSSYLLDVVTHPKAYLEIWTGHLVCTQLGSMS